MPAFSMKLLMYGLRRDFSRQKSGKPGRAIELDHAGVQENKVIKNCIGIADITRNENSKHVLACTILSSIFKEMMEIGGTNISKASLRHHQLSPFYSKCQNESISVLVDVLDAYV